MQRTHVETLQVLLFGMISSYSYSCPGVTKMAGCDVALHASYIFLIACLSYT
jgi:hypothetical protein